jgi:hypothetical protein
MHTTSAAATSARQRAARLHRMRMVRRRTRLSRLFWIASALVLPVWCAVTTWNGICRRCPTDCANNEAYEIAKSIELFHIQHHRLPTRIDELEQRSDGQGPIMDSLPRDPWGHPYALIQPALRSGRAVDVLSAGPDGVFFTGDDIGNWPTSL